MDDSQYPSNPVATAASHETGDAIAGLEGLLVKQAERACNFNADAEAGCTCPAHITYRQSAAILKRIREQHVHYGELLARPSAAPVSQQAPLPNDLRYCDCLNPEMCQEIPGTEVSPGMVCLHRSGPLFTQRPSAANTDICPRCGGSFEATGGKPIGDGVVECQKCAADF